MARPFPHRLLETGVYSRQAFLLHVEYTCKATCTLRKQLHVCTCMYTRVLFVLMVVLILHAVLLFHAGICLLPLCVGAPCPFYSHCIFPIPRSAVCIFCWYWGHATPEPSSNGILQAVQ